MITWHPLLRQLAWEERQAAMLSEFPLPKITFLGEQGSLQVSLFLCRPQVNFFKLHGNFWKAVLIGCENCWISRVLFSESRDQATNSSYVALRKPWHVWLFISLCQMEVIGSGSASSCSSVGEWEEIGTWPFNKQLQLSDFQIKLFFWERIRPGQDEDFISFVYVWVLSYSLVVFSKPQIFCAPLCTKKQPPTCPS